MKIGYLGAALVLLAGCGEQASEPEAGASEKTTIETPALKSGIDLSNVDTSVRPQDDFYLYVNGNWIKHHEIPDDKTVIGSFYDLRDKADEDVKAIIEDLSKRTDLKQGSDEQKVADLFRSYMDTETLNKLGMKPLEPELTRIDHLNTPEEIAAYLGSQRERSISSPLQFYVSVDAKDSGHYAAHIWQGGLGLPDRDYYLSDTPRYQELRKQYVAHMAKMFELAGFPEPEKTAQKVMALETSIAKLHWTRVESRDSEKRYNKFSIEKLKAEAPEFHWDAYFAALGTPDLKDIIINQPDFVAGFAKLFAATDLPTIKAYLRWLALNSAASYLSEPFEQQNFAFYGKVLSGQKEQKPRWKRGVGVVNGTLGEIVGKIYVSRHFKPEAKARMQQLVENLRQAYGESIDGLDWMSEDTKKQAKAKLAAFKPKIGYPDKWRDYSDVEIKADDLLGNLLRASKFEHMESIEKIGQPIREWEWGMTPQTVNAYYSPTRNEIVFPAAILQPPFFDMNADDAVNYGGIGAVIGHEMGHGFDDQGSRYDGQGNLNNWWTEKDLSEFKKRTAKLVEQYNRFQVFPDLHVNGELTLGENIGDLSGVTIAYKAYKRSLQGKPAPVIDGLTGDQRFFMGFGQIWRNKIREEALRNRVATDPHSPGHFRANGPLSNMPEFYTTFDVKPGDKMYLPPEERVKIW
jgi:endothelin-converting enzyme/putative endopeptidase